MKVHDGLLVLAGILLGALLPRTSRQPIGVAPVGPQGFRVTEDRQPWLPRPSLN